jgi:hypothetical protein
MTHNVILAVISLYITCREMAVLFQHHRIWSSAVKARCFWRYLLGRFSPQVDLANSAGLPYPVITFPNSDWVRFKRPGRGNRGGGGPPPTMCGDYAGSSGDFLPPPSPPGEKATARQDEAGHASTHDGAGNEREGANAESRGPVSIEDSLAIGIARWWSSLGKEAEDIDVLPRCILEGKAI